MVDHSAGQSWSPPTPMRWWDIPSVTALEAALFAADSPWTSGMFWAELASDHRYRVVRALSGQVLGYAGVAIRPDLAEVHTIGVSPRVRRRGLGTLLLRDMLAAVESVPVMLEVRCDNEPAVALYRSHGFEQMGMRRGYYQPSGADAYTMMRPAVPDAGRSDHPRPELRL